MELSLYRVQRRCHWSGQPKASHSPVGRWHTGKEQPILYLAESPALALLEWMKGMMSPKVAVAELVCIELVMVELVLALSDDILQSVDPATLPADWRLVPYAHSTATQAIGNAWLNQREHLTMRVPSATLPDYLGWNVIVNVAHPAYPSAFKPERVAVTPLNLEYYLGFPSASG